MNTHLVKIGMREFREHMPQYLKSTSPVAITRHGETVGFYIPTHHPEKSDLEELKNAAKQLDKLLLSKGITEEELLSEFRSLRESKEK
jgi:PHD/YefM family antitoxin component YafN of YafNO toxin-antitoxin module